MKTPIAWLGMVALAGSVTAQENDLAARRAPLPQYVDVKWSRSAPSTSTSFRLSETPVAEPSAPGGEKRGVEEIVPKKALPLPADVAAPALKSAVPVTTPRALPDVKPTGPVTTVAPAAAVADCGCNPCGPDGGFWVQGDYLLWWMRGARSIPLASASAPGTPLANAGVLGTPGSTTLFGDNSLNNGMQQGAQLRAGLWLDSAHRLGLEGGVLFLGGDNEGFRYGSPTGSTIVSRPFFNALTGRPDAELVSFPGILAGGVGVDASIPQFWGYDVVLRRQLCCSEDPACDGKGLGGYSRFDLLVGYRHYDFSDRVDITEALTPLDPGVVPGTQIVVQDSFRSRNRFDGIVLGLAGQRARDRFIVQGAVRLNVGQVTRETSIWGVSTAFVPGEAPSSGTGGLLALNSNVGTFRNSDWIVLPEAEIKLGYRITERLTAFAGYNVIIWPKVARAAEQIDAAVNTNQLPPAVAPLPGPARPSYFNSTSTLWMQGLSLGLSLQF